MMITPHKRVWERPFQSSKAKNALFKGQGGTEELARAATRNEPWGPTGTQLNELATLSHQGQCDVIFGILRERLEDPRSSRWRKVYKALQTVEFLAKRGAPCCVMSAQQLTPIMQLLQETYTHHSSDGKDTGKNVRIRAAAVVCLLQDVEGLNAEREYFAKRAAAGELGAGADAETNGVAGSPDGTSVNDGAIEPSSATHAPQLTGAKTASQAPMKVQMTPEQKAEVCAALARVLTLEGNAVCADCGQAEGMRPTWASTSCGVLLCMRCAGIHRSMGVHVSKVRSTTMDKWTPSLVDALERAGGNARANAYYEALLPQGHARPKNQEVERFIFNKYALRRWAQPDAEWPPPPPYSAAAAAEVIATSTYDLQQADGTGTSSAASQSTTGGGNIVDAAAGRGVELQPEEKEGGAAQRRSHAWDQQPSDAQGGADVANTAHSDGATKEGSPAADSEAAQAIVEFEGVVLGQEVLSVAMGMVSQMRGKQSLPASVVPADASGVATSCSAAVLRAARAGGSTSSALRGTLTPPMPPPSPPKASPPPTEPARPATPPVPESQPEMQKAELGDLLGPELGGEEEQEESARLGENEEEDTGLAAELQALPPMLELTTHPSPPHAAPCTPNPKIWTPRPPFYVTANPPPPPLLLPPSYPEELRPPLPPLLLPPQHIEEPMPGQLLLGAPPPPPLPNEHNGPNVWHQGPPQSFAELPPPSAQPRPPVLQESPTLQMGLEELAAVVPAGKPGLQDGGASMAGAAQLLAPMAAAVPAPATPPVATPALAFTTPGTAPAPAPAPAPLQPWVGTKREESFSALASPPTPPACAQPPMLTRAEPTLGFVPPPPSQLPTNCAEPTLGFVPPPLAQPPTHCAEPPLLAPPPPPPESSMANASVVNASVANAPAAAAEPTLGVPGPSSVPSSAPASTAMAAEESLPPTAEAAPPPPANAEACSAMQSPFASSAAAAAAAAAAM